MLSFCNETLHSTFLPHLLLPSGGFGRFQWLVIILIFWVFWVRWQFGFGFGFFSNNQQNMQRSHYWSKLVSKKFRIKKLFVKINIFLSRLTNWQSIFVTTNYFSKFTKKLIKFQSNLIKYYTDDWHSCSKSSNLLIAYILIEYFNFYIFVILGVCQHNTYPTHQGCLM